MKAKKSSARAGRQGTKKAARGRRLIDTRKDKRYVRRDGSGRFDESDDQGRSLTSDRRRKAKKTAKRGHGDKGDRERR